jgi:hypothetical protein
MIKRTVIAVALLLSVLASAPPARATCQPGYIGIRDGKPVVQLPRCDPYPP